jgi:uncharacterized protein
MSNIDTVKQIYESFGRHDVPAIVSKLAEDVKWEYGNGQAVPWLQDLKGHDAVTGFFKTLGSFLDVNLLHPRMFFETDNTVLALLDVQRTYKDTGKVVDSEDEVHIWQFDSEGKVLKFGHRLDTHSHWIAAQKN